MNDNNKWYVFLDVQHGSSRVKTRGLVHYFIKVGIFSFSAIALLLTMFAGTSLVRASPTSIIFSNGTLATGATSKSGVAAPATKQWSELQNNAGDTTSSNTNNGSGCQVIGTTTSNRCADDFIVRFGETWTINQVVVFGYQTGAVGPVSPFIGATLRIWNGRPGDTGSTIIFGDTTTNRLASSTDSNLFRIFNSIAPSPGTAPGTTRIIWQNNLNVSQGLVLTAGNYWIDWDLNAGASGNFSPTATVVNTRGLLLWNARQFLSSTGIWIDAVDSGNPVTAEDYRQDFPFQLEGSRTGTAARPTSFDFDGDGRGDQSVFRPTGAVWFVDHSTYGPAALPFGLPTDKLTPADYDGDGKTDYAIFRDGTWWILQSTINQLRVASFGAAGDIPRPGDYDGDGIGDLCVFRPSTGTWWRQNSTNGQAIAVQFGQNGDIPMLGDYDGDGKLDPAVFRPSNGTWYVLRSGDNQPEADQFGLSGDVPLNGDFNADGKADLAVFRPSNGTWYIAKPTGVPAQSFDATNFGIATDIPIPADYDGDGKTDIAIYRNGTWWVLRSTSGQIQITQFGVTTDKPVEASYAP